jgi:long-chain fatty acid transport protein
MFGFGPRSSAMAGTGAADAEGWHAAYTNPAGLVGPGVRRRLTFGYVGARWNLSMDDAPRDVDATDGAVIGASLPLPFGGILKDRIGIGFGFYFPAGVINRARDDFPGRPRLSLLDNRTQIVSILIGFGVKLHERVSLGLGVLALAALRGEITLRSEAGGRISTVSEQQMTADIAAVAGIRVVAARWLKLGVAYRGESRSTYDIQVKNSLGAAIPITLPIIRIAGTAQYDPHQLALEGAFRATHWLTIATGVTWKHWSSYDPPVQNATSGAPAQASPEYHDTVVPRLAFEAIGAWGRVRLAGRLGYFFEWSPAPQGPDRIYLDADRHVLTGGAGLEFNGRLISFQIDAFAQWHHLDGNPRAGGDAASFGLALGLDL